MNHCIGNGKEYVVTLQEAKAAFPAGKESGSSR
jgi:predicted ABC-class ATPase